MNLFWQNLRVLSEDFMILDCVVLTVPDIQTGRVADRHAEGRIRDLNANSP